MPGLLDYLSQTAVHLPEETVTVDEWGGQQVTLRGWTSRERDLFEEDNLHRAQKKAGNGKRPRQGVELNADLTNFRARLLSRTIVEDGVRIFANAKGETLLGEQPASVIDRLFAVAQRLHGMSQRDVESLVGNASSDSEEITDEDSSSSSPEPSAELTLN